MAPSRKKSSQQDSEQVPRPSLQGRLMGTVAVGWEPWPWGGNRGRGMGNVAVGWELWPWDGNRSCGEAHWVVPPPGNSGMGRIPLSKDDIQ